MNIIKQYKLELALVLNKMRQESNIAMRNNMKHHSRWLSEQIAQLTQRPVGM